MSLFTEVPPRVRDQRAFDRHTNALCSALNGVTEKRLRDIVLAVIVAQMLPKDSHLKGGMSLKLQLGIDSTRSTADLDCVRTESLERFKETLEHNLTKGWGSLAFTKKQLKKFERIQDTPKEPVAITGSIDQPKKREPKIFNARREYLADEFLIKLFINAEPLGTLHLDVGHNELDLPTNNQLQRELDPLIVEVVESYGFGTVSNKVAFMPPEQQLAQKIHAFAHNPVARAHDLIDLQIMSSALQNGELQFDRNLFTTLTTRTFAYRGDQPHYLASPSDIDKEYLHSLLSLGKLEEASLKYENGLDEIANPETLLPNFDQAAVWFLHQVAEFFS